VTVVSGGLGGSAVGDTILRLARRGDHVVVVGRDEHGLAKIAAGARGAIVETHVLETADRVRFQGLIASLTRRLGPIAYLFVGHNTPRLGPLADMAAADWEGFIRSCIDGPFNVCRAVLAHMAEHRRGALVLGLPDPGEIGVARRPGNEVARLALSALTRALASEFAGAGIRVNAVETPSPMPPALGIRQEGIATLVDFLLSDRAAFITGQTMRANDTGPIGEARQ
jgi:3-oxoacyl-[acyl-carrier protein] reductase